MCSKYRPLSKDSCPPLLPATELSSSTLEELDSRVLPPFVGSPEDGAISLFRRWLAGCATGVVQLNRDVLVDPAVGSFLFIVSAPILHFRTGVVKAHETVCVKAFAAELAIERFDKRIIGRLAGPREVEGDAFRVGPEIEIARDELAALMDANGLRIPSL